MIEPVKKDLETVIQAELQRAKDAHGAIYHSPHEAYAVLREEVEEAAEALEKIKEIATGRGKPRGGEYYFWEMTRSFKNIPAYWGNLFDIYDGIMNWAKNLAAEAVQVAAVCQKAMDSMAPWTEE